MRRSKEVEQRQADRTDQRLRRVPGEVASIEPHHDAWIVGDEPCVMFDFDVAQAAKR
jgi:hypothetical protein